MTLVTLVFLGRLTDTGSSGRIKAVREAILECRRSKTKGTQVLTVFLYGLYICRIGYWGMITAVFIAAFGAVGAICGANWQFVRDILRDFYCFIQTLVSERDCKIAT